MRKQMPVLGAVAAIALTGAMVWQRESWRVAMTLRLVPVALLLGTSSALAFDTSKLIQFGSLPLDDLTPVIAKLAPLRQEISKALFEDNKKRGDVICLGMRFPGPWKNLGRGSTSGNHHLSLYVLLRSNSAEWPHRCRPEIGWPHGLMGACHQHSASADTNAVHDRLLQSMCVRFSDSEQWSSPVKPPRSQNYVKPHDARTRVRVGKVLAPVVASEG
jgi:hypothetical protein